MSDARTIVCDIAALPADAHAVDALARLQLTARRLHRRLRLQRASPQLEELLDFAGLADVVAPNAPPRCAGQRGRHREQREQPPRREERVDRRDPPT
ncbi:MAG: STAS domain-containing protein [Actinomycetota bacterium]|nr:STAS domain-containing protein [Actinomycetota bacterium]